MTGESIPTKENLDKLLPYYRKIVSGFLIVGGSFLLLEHLFTFGCFDLLDFIGHEYYGLAMIITGFLVSIDYKQWNKLDLNKFRNWFR